MAPCRATTRRLRHFEPRPSVARRLSFSACEEEEEGEEEELIEDNFFKFNVDAEDDPSAGSAESGGSRLASEKPAGQTCEDRSALRARSGEARRLGTRNSSRTSADSTGNEALEGARKPRGGDHGGGGAVTPAETHRQEEELARAPREAVRFLQPWSRDTSPSPAVASARAEAQHHHHDDDDDAAATAMTAPATTTRRRPREASAEVASPELGGARETRLQSCDRRRRARRNEAGRRRSLGDAPAASTWQTRLWASLHCPELASREENRLRESVERELQCTSNTALVVKKLQTLLGEPPLPTARPTLAARRPRHRANAAALARRPALQTDIAPRFRPMAPAYDPTTPPAPLRKSIREPRRVSTAPTTTVSPRFSAQAVGSLARSNACGSLVVTSTPLLATRKSARAAAPSWSPNSVSPRRRPELGPGKTLRLSTELGRQEDDDEDARVEAGSVFTPKPPVQPRSADKLQGFNAAVHVSRKIVRV